MHRSSTASEANPEIDLPQSQTLHCNAIISQLLQRWRHFRQRQENQPDQACEVQEEKVDGNSEVHPGLLKCCLCRITSDVVSQSEEEDSQDNEGSHTEATISADEFFNHHVAGFLSSTLAYYCFGLTFFISPTGPSAHVPDSEMARNAYRLSPAAFYSLFAGRFVGAPLFGHFGDLHGRRPALSLALLLVGLTTIVMGCFPFRDSREDGPSGVWAVIRFLQGIGIGGQWPGTILISMEACKDENHGAVAAGISHSGVFIGLGLAAGAAYQLLGQDGGGAPMRAAFCIGGGLMLPTAAWAYCGDHETEFFRQREMGDMERYPWLAMGKQQFWALLFGWATLLIDAWTQAMLIYQWPIIFPHGSGFGPHGHDNEERSATAATKDVQGCIAMALLVAVAVTIVSAVLRGLSFSRCLLYRIGAVLTCVCTWLFFILAAGTVRRHKPLGWLFGGYILVLGLGLGTMQGPLAALMAEPFPTRIAYAGVGTLYHTAHAAVGAAYPSLASWLLRKGTSSMLTLQGGVRPIYLGVVSLIATALALYTTPFLKGYARVRSLAGAQGLRVRDCVAMSFDVPSTTIRPAPVPQPRAQPSGSFTLPEQKFQPRQLPLVERDMERGRAIQR
jgi:hypothetical protein